MSTTGPDSDLAEIQLLLDDLAQRVGQPILLNDHQLRLIAHSSHGAGDDSDPVRIESILLRHPPEGVTAWLRQHGVGRAREAFTVPANPGLRMRARTVVPVLDWEGLMGYLWLAAADPHPDVLAATRDAALMLAPPLRARRALANAETDRRAALLVAALNPYDDTSAALHLAQALNLPATTRLQMLVLLPVHRHAVHAETALLQRLADAAQAGRPGMATAGLEGGDGTPAHVAAVAPSHGRQAELSDLARRLADVAVAAIGDQDDWRCTVGASGTATPVPLPLAHLRALSTAQVAARIPALSPSAVWDRLGSYGALAELGALDQSVGDWAHLQAVRDRPDGDVLLETLRVYLDAAGDVQSAAAALFVHRTTLYHRLRRIEEVTSMDLASGEDRLLLHLTLRLRALRP